MTDKSMTAEAHQQKMARRKKIIDAKIDAADTDKGLIVVLTGNGKGKSSSAFGMVMRALGHGLHPAIVQFIKGAIASGEEIFIREHTSVPLVQMGTGFTWETQNRESDQAAAIASWQAAQGFLNDDQTDLVVLDELTYMLHYDYLNLDDVLNALGNRPAGQHVVVTGRGAPKELLDLADTVSEIDSPKHAFKQKIRAQKGVDY